MRCVLSMIRSLQSNHRGCDRCRADRLASRKERKLSVCSLHGHARSGLVNVKVHSGSLENQ